MNQLRLTYARSSILLALSMAALAGCGGDTEPAPNEQPDELLAPPPEGQGIQFKMNTELEPGTEGERCMFVKAPADAIFVNHDEVRYSKGSHHFLLYETTYTEIPTKKVDGTPVDTSGVFDCSDGATNGWDVTKLVAGSQNANGTSMLAFPPDVAMKVRAGAILLMNAHYINTTAEVLKPEVRINLYTVPEADVKTEGDILFLYNPFIYVAPQSQGRAHMRCPVHKDITIQNVQSHMHARGNGYAAVVGGGSEPFYTNTLWEGVPVKDFGEGLKVPAGSILDYYCDYKNAEARDVYQGPRSTDEMCMLIGSYYPADPATANCRASEDDPFVGADWVGNGSATCAATFSCMQQALSKDFHATMPCITNSDPAVSKEMSAAVRCLFKSLGQGQDPTMVCQSEFAACLAK